MLKKYYIQVIGILIAPLFCHWVASAQEDHFSLEDCIHYALEHSARIHQSIASDRIQAAKYTEAIGAFLPNISASTSAYINYGRGIDPATNTYSNINSFRNNYGIEASLLIFDGLSSVFNLKRERYEKVAGREELKKTQEEVRIATIEAYYNLLYTKELKRLASENLRNSEQQSKKLEKMFEVGMKARQDVSEMKATEAEDRLKLVQQSNQYEIALLQLKAAMNYPIEKELIITDALTYTAEVIPTLLKANEVYATAIHKLPQALIANERLKSSEASYKSRIGDFFPGINLFAGYNTSFSFYMDGSKYESFQEQLKNRRGAYIGVALRFDLFTGLRKSSNLKRAKAELYAEQSRKEETYMEIYKDIQEAILNLNASVQEYNASVEKAHHLEEVYQAGLKNYNVGNISSIELSLAASRAKEAQNEVARKLTMYLICKEWLAYYAQ